MPRVFDLLAVFGVGVLVLYGTLAATGHYKPSHLFPVVAWAVYLVLYLVQKLEEM